ncbi:MAG: hypothetical protein IJI67_03300 [Clostridia bacterium]|nr:hypothetical protein [Clostridia bacterium]
MAKKAKRNSILKKIPDYTLIYYLAPFLILSAVMVVLMLSGHNFSAYSYYIIHYLYTYRHGYISRGFIGELISWFVQTVTPQVTAAAVIIGSFLLIIAASVCIGFVLNKVKKEKELFWLIFWFIVILCLSPFTFRNYLTAIKIDKFVWAVTLFAMPLLAYKKAIWMVPPLCVLAIVINPIFLFTSLVALAIPLLQKIYDEKYSRKMIALCAVTYALCIIVGLASAISEKHVGFANAEEMVRYYFSRYVDENGNSVVTRELIQGYGEDLLIDFFMPFKELLPTAMKANLTHSDSFNGILFNLMFFVVPVNALLIAFWCTCIKNSKAAFQKFIFVVCILSPLVAVLPSILSGEISKYFSNNVFAQACVIIFFIVSRNEAVLAAVGTVKRKAAGNKVLTAIVVSYLTLLMIR